MPPIVGKYFYLKNKFSNLYLDSTGFSFNSDKILPGKSQTLLRKKKTKENESDYWSQIWYQDCLTGTLRNKMTNLCLDITGQNRAVVDVFKINEEECDQKISGPSSIFDLISESLETFVRAPGHGQRWHYNKDTQAIESYLDPTKVLDVVGQSKGCGAEICVSDYNGSESQTWRLESEGLEYFYITSQTEPGLAVDLLGGRNSPGSRVGLYARKTKTAIDSQLWFEDFERNLRPKLNEKLVLNVTRTGTTVDTPDPEYSNQYWVISGNRIVNAYYHNYVISYKTQRNSIDSIEGSNDDFVVFYNSYKGLNSQHWSFIYD